MEIVHSYAAADEMVGLSMFDGSNDCFFHSGIVHAAEISLFCYTCNFHSLLSFIQNHVINRVCFSLHACDDAIL